MGYSEYLQIRIDAILHQLGQHVMMGQDEIDKYLDQLAEALKLQATDRLEKDHQAQARFRADPPEAA